MYRRAKTRCTIGRPKALALCALLLSVPAMTAAHAALPSIYAQVLVNRIVAAHPRLARAEIDAYPSGAPVSASRVIAAKEQTRIGRPAGTANLKVLWARKAQFRRSASGRLYVAVLQLLDIREMPVGTITLAVKYRSVAREARQRKSLLAIRDGLKVLIPGRAALFQADRRPREIYAQELVDDVMAEHPQLVRMSFHVPPPGAPVENSYVIAGKDLTYVHLPMIGSPSGPEDFPHLTSGRSHFFFFKKQDFYKGMLPLDDAAGEQIGVLLLGCKYASARHSLQYQRLMNRIRVDLMSRIPDRAALFRPVG